jgi:hypothetical protein
MAETAHDIKEDVCASMECPTMAKLCYISERTVQAFVPVRVIESRKALTWNPAKGVRGAAARRRTEFLLHAVGLVASASMVARFARFGMAKAPQRGT